MSAQQPSVELTTRDVFQQVDRRLSLIEGDLRALDAKFDTLDAKFDALHLTTKQDILEVKQDLRELELRLKHDLTVRLGGMMVVGITVVATLVKLL